MLGYPDAQTDCRESRLLASPLARRANRTGWVRVSRDTAATAAPPSRTSAIRARRRDAVAAASLADGLWITFGNLVP